MGKKKLELTAEDVLENLPIEEYEKLFDNQKFLNNAYAEVPDTDTRAWIADLLEMSKKEAEKTLSTDGSSAKTGQEKRKGGEEEEEDGVQDDDTMDGEAEEWDTTDGESEEEDTKDGEAEKEDTMDGEAEEKDMDKAVKTK